jgi:AraC-like DNA-binding protein
MNRLNTTRIGALPTATGGIARLALTHARHRGVEPKTLLERAGVTSQQINDRGARLTVQHQIEFLNLVAKSLDDELLGFHLAQLPDLRELGLLFYVAASSPTLGEALQRAARYSSIVNEGLSLRCLLGNEIRLVFEYVGVSRHSDRHQIEFLMIVLIRLCRQLTRRRLVPRQARISHCRGRRRVSELAAFFGYNITFGAPADELTFGGAVKALKVTGADPYLNELLVANCEQALSRRLPRQGAFRVAVENAIVPLLPHGKVRASEIAGRLGLSGRTCARRLAAEGISFSQVLLGLRSDLARRYLSDPNLSISRIAWLLGYREVSAFTHAYKRWSGKTPREARARLTVSSATSGCQASPSHGAAKHLTA